MATTTPPRTRRPPASSLELPVTALPGVGEESAKLLDRLGIRTIEDLLWHLPRTYLDYSKFTPLRQVRAEQEQTVEAILGRIGQRRTATGKQMTEVELVDPADHAPTNIRATWFGRQFIKERFPEGQLVRISGKVRFFGRSLQFSNPKIEPASAERVHTGRIVPMYRLTEGLKEGVLRRWLHTAVEGGPKRTPVVREVAEPIPTEIRERRKLLPVQEALREIHFPSEWQPLFAARRRLAFDELLVLQLALAIVDEQHRFGVRQRAIFREKGVDPHLLLTTATPIPQTLSQTVYRDLDITELHKLPSGEQQIVTEVRPTGSLARLWPWLRKRVDMGEQVFVVTPRIEEDEEDDVPSAEGTHRDLAEKELAGLRVALLHGRMPVKERDAVMARFAAREIDVLVATTVIEVGIDIPNATVMVVLGADRFGLAQLHQLRGRVGRRGQKAFCVLVSEKAGESERLTAMTEIDRRTGKSLDGFELAKRDLAIRGAGQFLGELQAGLENELRIVDLADLDPALLDETAIEADQILARDPQLERPEHAGLAAAVDDLWRRYALA
ncbi:MAG TPA: helicase-related protein [Candidatus Acidoferrales bacterium]|nr:helicase-related protein [Candidatus Acidoferrales bacterium]